MQHCLVTVWPGETYSCWTRQSMSRTQSTWLRKLWTSLCFFVFWYSSQRFSLIFRTPDFTSLNWKGTHLRCSFRAAISDYDEWCRTTPSLSHFTKYWRRQLAWKRRKVILRCCLIYWFYDIGAKLKCFWKVCFPGSSKQTLSCLNLLIARTIKPAMRKTLHIHYMVDTSNDFVSSN